MAKPGRNPRASRPPWSGGNGAAIAWGGSSTKAPASAPTIWRSKTCTTASPCSTSSTWRGCGSPPVERSGAMLLTSTRQISALKGRIRFPLAAATTGTDAPGGGTIGTAFSNRRGGRPRRSRKRPRSASPYARRLRRVDLERHSPRLGSRLDRGPARLDGQQGTSVLGDDVIQSSERGGGTCGNRFYAEPAHRFLHEATLTDDFGAHY